MAPYRGKSLARSVGPAVGRDHDLDAHPKVVGEVILSLIHHGKRWHMCPGRDMLFSLLGGPEVHMEASAYERLGGHHSGLA